MGVEVIGGTPARLITKSNSAGSTLALISGVSITPGSGTYSSWVQLTASLAAETLLTGVSLTSANALDVNLRGPITVDVGIGGAGAEVTLSTLVIHGGDPQYAGGGLYQWFLGGCAEFAPWLRVAAGQRVAMRARAASNSTPTGFTADVFTAPYANLETF
jgi:hypothetical protein